VPPRETNYDRQSTDSLARPESPLVAYEISMEPYFSNTTDFSSQFLSKFPRTPKYRIVHFIPSFPRIFIRFSSCLHTGIIRSLYASDFSLRALTNPRNCRSTLSVVFLPNAIEEKLDIIESSSSTFSSTGVSSGNLSISSKSAESEGASSTILNKTS